MNCAQESAFVEVEQRIRKHLLTQFKERIAQKELRKLGPTGVNWVARTLETLDLCIPIFPKLAAHLQQEVPQRLNSAAKADSLASEAPKHLQEAVGPAVKIRPDALKWANALKAATAVSKTLIGNIDSQHVSSEIQRQTVAFFNGKVKANGGSLYPDILLVGRDYEMLPPQKRGKGKQIDGPCLRGQHISNVPDGFEIKANEGNRIKVDAHAAHAGLHFGVTWELLDEQIKINGVWVAYVRFADHSKPVRNVPTTTLKYSFGHNLFISALP
jgi:hypothetical protein